MCWRRSAIATSSCSRATALSSPGSSRGGVALQCGRGAGVLDRSVRRVTRRRARTHRRAGRAPPPENPWASSYTSALVAAERRASSSQACCAELMSRVHLADTAGRAATRRAKVDGLWPRIARSSTSVRLSQSGRSGHHEDVGDVRSSQCPLGPIPRAPAREAGAKLAERLECIHQAASTSLGDHRARRRREDGRSCHPVVQPVGPRAPRTRTHTPTRQPCPLKALPHGGVAENTYMRFSLRGLRQHPTTSAPVQHRAVSRAWGTAPGCSAPPTHLPRPAASTPRPRADVPLAPDRSAAT